ncbi:hypothetical protein NIES2119_09445 [[Phormidium ambiguum] IAM M-71]|uniref:Uncharacterized protein n=1 Tax=[Phormidium ambiguum] IAM M-71 TaxID=454136 RepID=A0A1U7IN82_9CYAN|nr:hypothetical protein [Phormidium ambiguum]OKH38801.1 hypothetical protein NIES2119_09445 [Phormidium ambiguum IAM M-71]
MKASNENNSLRVAEKISVGASVAGTLAAVWSQQMIVAAAPLTLALSLNLINRGKFQQKLEDDVTAIVSEIDNRIQQVDKEVAGEMRSLQASVQDLSLSSKNLDSQPIKTEISDLQRQFVSLEEALSNVTSKITKETPEIPPNLATFDPNYLEQQIYELKAAIVKLEGIIYQNEEKDKIAKIQADFAKLSADFQERTELQEITELRKITAFIQQTIAELPTTTTSVDSSYLEQEINQLKQNLVQLNSEFRERELQQVSELRQITDTVQEKIATLTSTTSFDASYLERDIKQLKDYYAGLSVEVKERSESQQIAEIRQIIESLQQNLADRTTELQTVKPEFDPTYLEQENQQLKLEIASLKQQLTTSNEQVAMIPQLLENFAQMQQQLQELQQKTEKLSPKIPMFPPSKPPESVQKKSEKFVISRFTDFATYYNSGKLSLESILQIAEENGIGEEFQSILKIASKHQLTFASWPTNLMISPPKTRMLSVPSNCSKCLFIVSAKPSDEGKLKVWLSPNAIAKFYPTNKHNLSLIFGEEGWREMGKAEVKNFVATLNQLLG